MATIETRRLCAATRPDELWRSLAEAVHLWLAQREVAAEDTVLLLPFAELLTPARRALARVGGWMPRVHTPRTLAAALGAPLRHAAGALSGVAAIDRAAARDLLRAHAWADAWWRRDPRAFDAALTRLVRSAHALRTAAIARPPNERAAWWQSARQQVVGASGPGATHRLMLRAAIEWCAIDDSADTDRLFDHRAAAWIALTLGGEDPLASNLLRHAASQGVPVLQLSADPAAPDPFDDWPEQCHVEVEVADDAESEAQAAAWQVARQVRAGVTPVALVAQDRALVRRVRALLERLQIDVVDETGWALATTRAGAHACAALRAARANARPDDVLDWLKADLGESAADELAALERIWRGARLRDAKQRARADALWQRERSRIEAFAQPPQRALGRWLRAFDHLLFGAATERWHDDAAAQQLRRALRLNDPGAHGPAWADASSSTWTLEEFTAWVDATLEESAFVPPAGEHAAAVVVTPLSRAIGRDFALAVLPGADQQRLGPLPPETGLLDEATRRALGLPDRAASQRRAALSFLQLLRLPRVVALRRRADGDELLSASPWLERLRLARQQRAAPNLIERDVQLPQRMLAMQPTPRPLPQAAGNLPRSLSASAVEALRQCPYRFFSRAALHLSEHEELDDDADKREAGQWLHATLERFHVARGEPRSVEVDAARFIEAGRDTLRAMAQEGVSEEAMLPFSAGLPALASRYVAWLHAQEAQGWQFAAAEVRIEALPTGRAALVLNGRIDRIDTHRASGTVRLIDYKTSARKALEDKVRVPLEDTQLAVYVALQSAREPDMPVIEACYLALDEADEVVAVPHEGVAATAQILTERIAAELARIEAGAPLPALGEGPVCETCEARGLCRRDHWSDEGAAHAS